MILWAVSTHRQNLASSSDGACIGFKHLRAESYNLSPFALSLAAANDSEQGGRGGWRKGEQ
jgi:hypothetical protein